MQRRTYAAVIAALLMVGSAANTATINVATGNAATVTRNVPAVGTTADPTLAAAGDIACGASDANYNGGNGTATACRMKYTSDLLVTGGYTGVLTLGDNMQSDPSPTGFATVFNATWGRVKPLIHPEAGNHDYDYPGAKGYFGYFGSAAGDPAKGYYSFDLGSWHLIALNSNCAQISGGCARGGAEGTWLRADLSAHLGRCILAFDHHARYSSGHDGDNIAMTDFYQSLYDAGADVLLSGHSHDYERFNPQDNAARLDTARGITQFVVGTGGSFFTGLGTRHPNSVTSQNSTFGVLSLTLHPASYDWAFRPEAGKTWTDSGSRACHAATPSDFSIIANPSALSMAPGQSGSIGISTTVTSGAPQNVALSATGLPSGATATFNPANFLTGSSSTLTIRTGSTTPTGTYSVVVTGTGSPTAHSVVVTLRVSSSAPPETPRLIQSAGGTEAAAATSLTTTMGLPTGSGHLLLLSASVHIGTTSRITSVTDTAGNTWTRAGAYAVSGHYSDGELWYAANARSTRSITVHLGAALVVAATAAEFSEIIATNPLDAVTGASSTGTSAISGPVPATAANELIVGFSAGHGNAQPMAVTGAGFTALAQQTSRAATIASVVTGYRLASSGSGVSFTASFGAPMYWAAAVAAFRSTGTR